MFQYHTHMHACTIKISTKQNLLCFCNHSRVYKIKGKLLLLEKNTLYFPEFKPLFNFKPLG